MPSSSSCSRARRRAIPSAPRLPWRSGRSLCAIPQIILKVLENDAVREPAIELLREAFDMLEEDYDEERFFATVRRAYWQAPANSPARRVADALIQKLEF